MFVGWFWSCLVDVCVPLVRINCWLTNLKALRVSSILGQAVVLMLAGCGFCLQATCKRFHDHCQQQGFQLPPKGFVLSYTTNIPRQAGLSGSSAIICAGQQLSRRCLHPPQLRSAQCKLFIVCPSACLSLS